MRWHSIIKDGFGFVYEVCLDEMYKHLPILIVSYNEGLYPTIEYIDEDNWVDILADLNKPYYKLWSPCGKIEFD